jgi:hypothetical protein
LSEEFDLCEVMVGLEGMKDDDPDDVSDEDEEGWIAEYV